MSPDLREVFDDAGRTPPANRSWDPDAIIRRGTTARRRRRAVTVGSTVAALAVVVGGVAVLAPLAPHRNEPGDGQTVTPTPGPSTTSAPPTPSSSPSPTPTGPTPSATVSACRRSDLVLALGQGGDAAGTAYLPVIATTSGGSCALGETPQVQPLGASGAPVGSAAARQQDASPTGGLVLEPSGHASFLLAFANTANYDPAACDPVALTALSLTITPGTDPVRLPLPAGYTTCRRDVSSLGTPLAVSRWRPTITGLVPETSGSGSGSASP